MENSDLDCLLGLGGQRRRYAESKTRRGGKPAATSRSLGDRAYGVEHRDFLCLDARDRHETITHNANRKERANR